MSHIHEHTYSHEGESLGVMIQHILGHSVLDLIYLIPFLFLTYVLMEWLEHASGVRTQEAIKRAGKAGPAIGALLGVVPQCGFSAVAATLYAGRVVTLGTLFAVLLSTSDEMLPIFIAGQVPPSTIIKILGTKIIIGMAMGFMADLIFRLFSADSHALRIHELCERDACDCNSNCATCANNPELAYNHHDDAAHHSECTTEICGHSHEDHSNSAQEDLTNQVCHEFSCETDSCKGHNHDHSHDNSWRFIARSALKHTVKVTLFVFAITLVLNAVLEVVGQDALAQILEGNALLSIVASAVVGLIPNCAASIVIAQLYVEGVLGAGAMMAGLLVSAGVGLLVLVRANRPVSQNLIIIALLCITGVFWGMLIQVLGISF